MQMTFERSLPVIFERFGKMAFERPEKDYSDEKPVVFFLFKAKMIPQGKIRENSV